MNSPVQMKLHSDEWKARKGKRRSGYHVDGEQNAEWVTRKVMPRDTHAKAKLALAIQKISQAAKIQSRTPGLSTACPILTLNSHCITFHPPS